MRLPLTATNAPLEDRTVPSAVPDSHVQGHPARRILLVDDNVDTTETLARLLRYMGQDVRTAHEGTAALKLAPAFKPDIVLLDIGLPGLNGYEVATLLRQQEGMDRTLLVALTGHSQQDPARSRDAGFHHYLIKPVGSKTLEKLLRDPAGFNEGIPSQAGQSSDRWFAANGN